MCMSYSSEDVKSVWIVAVADNWMSSEFWRVWKALSSACNCKDLQRLYDVDVLFYIVLSLQCSLSLLGEIGVFLLSFLILSTAIVPEKP